MSAAALTAFGVPMLRSLADAAERADPGDIQTLNAAIELENAGIKAYTDAAATGLLTKSVLVVASSFKRDHEAHRDALAGAVRASGAVPTQKTAALVYPPLHTQADVLAFAEHVERKAAATYLSVIPDLRDRKLAGVAAAILGVETTHVALLAQALGQFPAYKGGFTA